MDVGLDIDNKNMIQLFVILFLLDDIAFRFFAKRFGIAWLWQKEFPREKQKWNYFDKEMICLGSPNRPKCIAILKCNMLYWNCFNEIFSPACVFWLCCLQLCGIEIIEGGVRISKRASVECCGEWTPNQMETRRVRRWTA